VLVQISEHLFEVRKEELVDGRHGIAKVIGVKGAGLSLLPPAWTPPFIVVSCQAYREWREAGPPARGRLLAPTSQGIAEFCTREWASWSWGLVLRSSSTHETLVERGAYQSRELTADFGVASIGRAILQIYEHFLQTQGPGEIGIVVQARVQALASGHLSNEQRVSKTINQWEWEAEKFEEGQGRFNSQRAVAASVNEALAVRRVSKKGVIERLKQVARWCTELNSGRAHLEWGFSAGAVWVFQLDFEDDQPEPGHDPRELLRTTDITPPGEPPSGSPLLAVEHAAITGWNKIDKVREFLVGRTAPFPRLFFMSSEELLNASEAGRNLIGDIEAITKGRAVCRTDCASEKINRFNLPRTYTVSAGEALRFMMDTTTELMAKGAEAKDICFILHKFIPAKAAAWAMSRPDHQVVLVDSLWGLPDGLQYLPHDTFEYDVKRGEISAERTDFKPRFLQEMENGSWQFVRIARRFGRFRSLNESDLREIAGSTNVLACRMGKPIQVMWFCEVPQEVGVGRNVPWFMMDAVTPKIGSGERKAAPKAGRIVIRNLEDVENFNRSENKNSVLRLEPEAELFRSDKFLSAVSEAAKSSGCVVELAGSIQAHAFYVLDRSGIVLTAPTSGRVRVRQRRVFEKLVRDDVPNRIREHGEMAALAQIRKSEARLALTIKLFEEAQELLRAEGPEQVTGELADVLEVVRALCSATGVDWEQVQMAAEAKRSTRGSFERNMVLRETSWPGWSGRPNEGELPIISVKELARTSEHADGRRTLSFASVLADDALSIVQLGDGVRVSVKITAEGVEVRPVREDAKPRREQLAFDFG